MMISEKSGNNPRSGLGGGGEWSGLLEGLETKERKSEFVRSPLGNEDYIRGIFERDLNDVRGRMSSNSIKRAEQMMQENIGQYPSLAFRCFVSEQAAIQELVADPFLRQRHFDALLDIRMDGGYDAAIRELWSSDTNFIISATYFDRIGRVINDNPEIYSRVDEKGVEKRVNEAINDFSINVDSVMDGYKKDVWAGNKILMVCLQNMLLGASGEEVALRYSQTSLDESCGEWEFDKREIILYEEQIMKKATEKSKQINGVLSYNGELILCYINVIAHEMRHAYQDLGKDFDERTSGMYRKNSAYYVPFEYSYSKYRKQLIETEAFMFGDQLESFIRKMARFYDLE